MSTMFNAHVEVDLRTDLSNDAVDTYMEALAPYHASLGMSPRGYLSAQISVPAESLIQAATTAVAVCQTTFGRPAIACEVMTEKEFTAREGFVPLPELIGATEAAELLGVSRQRVQQMLKEGTLPGQLIGKSLVLPRTSVEQYAATHKRRQD